MTPSWYDVLGIDETATTDEIRAAWQESVAGLDPTDRRFKQRNRAAEVLLDPERRAAHDADLAAQEAESDDADEEDDATVEAGTSSDDDTDKVTQAGPSVTLDRAAATRDRADHEPGRGRLVVTVALGVVALLLAVATVLAVTSGGGSSQPASADSSGLPDGREVQAARKAAETAIGPVLSYDYRDLDRSREAATAFMTPRYAEVYEQNFAGFIQDNAPTTKTIVTAEVVRTGIVRTGKDRVDVLAFVNRPTRNASGDKVSRDQVTIRMLDVDGRWLVDCLITSPGGTC